MGSRADDGAALLDDKRKGRLWVWDEAAAGWRPEQEAIRQLQAHHREHWRKLVRSRYLATAGVALWCRS
jgi:hypothetical protein